jgi:hypothetical protein
MSHDTSSPEQLSGIACSALLLGRYIQTDLVDLMNLFMGWNMSIRKNKWLDRVGYR